MRDFSILVCAVLAFAAMPVRADLADPQNMAHAIREAGRDCNKVESMKKSEDPKEARVYHVVCDENLEYKVFLEPDGSIRIEND